MIRRLFLVISAAALTACGIGAPQTPSPVFQPFPGQGQYVRPDFLNAAPSQRVPAEDTCSAFLYQNLIGQHEGSIFFTGLPGRKRIIKPAQTEGFGYGPEDSFYVPTPFVEVRDFLADQSIYTPSFGVVRDRNNLGPDFAERMTIELDAQGYVRGIDCR